MRHKHKFFFTGAAAAGPIPCMLAISTALPQLRQPTCHLPADISCKCEEASSWQMGIFYLYGVGIGGIKSSVSGFETDQFDQTDDKEKAQMVNFFNRFNFFIKQLSQFLFMNKTKWVEVGVMG